MPEVISGSKLPDMAGEKLNQTWVGGARTRLRLWHLSYWEKSELLYLYQKQIILTIASIHTVVVARIQ